MDIEQLQKKNYELRALLKDRENECANAKDYMVTLSRSINELTAYIELLRDALNEYDLNGIIEFTEYKDLLTQTPSQSLNHIKAQAIEEYKDEIKCRVYFVDKTILDIGDDLIRKYKEQSND